MSLEKEASSADPALDIEKEVEEVFSLLKKRNEELKERKDPRPIFIPPRATVQLAVEHGHNAGEIVDRLTQDRENIRIYKLMQKHYSPPY